MHLILFRVDVACSLKVHLSGTEQSAIKVPDVQLSFSKSGRHHIEVVMSPAVYAVRTKRDIPGSLPLVTDVPNEIVWRVLTNQ